MASTTYNNSFYGQSNLLDMSLAYTQPSYNTDAYFNDSEETSSVASSLHSASKKINKASPQGAAKRSQKRSNRGRNPWTPKEDAKMLELMKKYGQSWAMISSLMDGRTGKQVRDRYLNKLRPNIKCGDWSLEEDEMLVALCKEIGNRWSLIANHLPGRTEGQVKNRYYSHIKKRLLPDGTYCPNIESRPSSESFSSFAASPAAEETSFDFGKEVNANVFNTYNIGFNQAPYMYSKGPFVVDEEDYASEQSTTQGPISQHDSESPRNDIVDPSELLSFDASTNFYYSQPQQADSFYLQPLVKDHQVDDMLTKVTDYFTQKTAQVSDVDSFFSDDLKTEVKQSSAYGNDAISGDKLMELNRRKAYLELALAKTLKEMKDL
jgi:hypothetical protein